LQGSAGPDRPLRILLTVNRTWNLYNFRLAVMRALLEEGHEVVCLAPDDETRLALESLGCRHIHLPMDNKGLSPLRDLALLVRFVRVFRRERPDVVLGYTIKNNLYGAMAARLVGTPFVPNVTGLGTAFLGGALMAAVARLLYRLAFSGVPVVFFQNEDDRDLFLEASLVRPGQARLLPGSGIDLAQFVPAPLPGRGDEVVFLLVARLLRDKGVGEFVEAARVVHRRFPAARFQLLGAVGDENRTAFDRATVDGWVAAGVVEYLGTTQDVRPFLREADCVVLPSYREGTPRTLLEAAAMARPLVATDVPGCRAVAIEGETGLLCRARDAADLARALERMIELGPEGRRRLGAGARRLVEERFDEQRVVAAYRAAIAEQMGGPSRERA
jgi:glycosyltransferase involved in cell wall biosynthesis